ncbi:MAG: peptidoglycan-binding protein [Lachnospiraceae bacterium]|nr:peptidoglycan-binding protein [Lachnospiraceae bacterium]
MKKHTVMALVVATLLLSGTAYADGTVISPDQKYVLFDQDGVKAILTGKFDDSMNCAKPEVIIENSTDKNIDVLYTGTMNGWNLGSSYMDGATDIKAGSKAKAHLWFMFDDFDITGSDDISNMDLTFTVKDHESHDELINASTGMLTYEGRGSAEEEAGESGLTQDGYVLFDQDGVKATLTGKSKDSTNCAKPEVIIENSSDNSVDVLYTGTMNGWNVGSSYMDGGTDIKPGSKANGGLWFMFDDFDISSSDDIETMNLTFTVKNHDTSDDMFEINTGDLDWHNLGASGSASAGETEQAIQVVDTADLVPNFVFHNEESADEGDAKYETLSVGSSGDAVVRLQQALIDNSLLTGSADGQYGQGTAAAVSAYQESQGLPANGSADSITQEKLYGEYTEPEVDVAEALQNRTWLFNGGDDLILNGISFDNGVATIAQVYFDGNGKHENDSNALSYVLNDSSITLTMLDGSEMEVPFEVKNGRLILNNGEWKSIEEVNAGLQGNWLDHFDAYGTIQEYHVSIQGDKFSYEEVISNGSYWLQDGNYQLNFGGIEGKTERIWNEDDFFYNIIDGEVKLIRFDHVCERTDKGLLGEYGFFK